MSTKELKLSINQIIEQTNDATILEEYYEILKDLLEVQQTQIIGYDENGQSITKQKLEINVLKAKKRMEMGHFIRI